MCEQRNPTLYALEEHNAEFRLYSEGLRKQNAGKFEIKKQFIELRGEGGWNGVIGISLSAVR